MTGFQAFTAIWVGQFVSLAGSAMTRFAFTIWAYDQTNSATVLALVGFFSFAPLIIFGPIAGALVDRWNRKLVMVMSDTAAGLSTLALLLLYASGNLEIWHLYVAGLWASTFESFQFPAFSAAITVMLDKQHYGRANGMMSLAQAASTVAAPILAGLLLATSGIGGVMLVDVVTFVFAVSTILVVNIPQPAVTSAGRQGRGSIWAESLYGFQYILQRPSLLGMQLLFSCMNFYFGMGLILTAPLVLARTGNDELALGSVQAAAGLGGVIGGLVITAWGGPKRRVHGVFMGWILAALLGLIVVGLGQGVGVWMVGSFLMMSMIPLMNASNQAIWQSKVAPDVQGRVFGVRRSIAQITNPIAMLVGGLLADNVFEPGMTPDGALAPIFGGLVGTGAGSGISLIFIFTGIVAAITGLAAFKIPVVRDMEDILPDAEVVETSPPAVPEGRDESEMVAVPVEV